MNRLRHIPPHAYLPPAILVLSLLGVYLATLAPGLSWANHGSDGGDLITAAATGGIPHPTGYPLYLLLAGLIQKAPVGSLAYRTNLLSAFFAVLTSLLIYRIVIGTADPSDPRPRWPAALCAGVAFGLAPLVWSQAVITEVYTLQAFLIALILYLYTIPGRLDRWRGLLLGLAVGNHLTTLLLVPAALVIGSLRNHREEVKLQNLRVDKHALLRQVGLFGAGLCIYLILPVRALGAPPVNWGNVINPSRLWWLVSGQLYRSYYLQLNAAEIWQRVQESAARLLEQFGIVGVGVALLGLVVFWRPSPAYLLSLWSAVVYMLFAVLYGSADSYLYQIPALVSFAIWIGWALTGVQANQLSRYPWARMGVALVFLTYVIVRALSYVPQVDASSDRRAEEFGRQMMAEAPADAILFTRGDESLFTLWYFHFALGERPDMAVISEELLHFDWYQETLRLTYPSLVVPGPLSWPETVVRANPARTACFVIDTQLDCRSQTASP